MRTFLDAKYKAADLNEVVLNCEQLMEFLTKYETLFDGTLGHWTEEEYDIELQQDAEPYHARPYPIPKTYETPLKMEVERLVASGVLKKVNRSK